MQIKPGRAGIRDQASLCLLQVTVAITFALSYAGLQRYAISTDQSIPWLWPAALDVPALGVAVVVWRAQELGHQAWGGRAFVAALVALSTGLQVSTVPGDLLPALPARVGHGIPPLVLYGLWETVLWSQRLRRAASAGQAGGTVHPPSNPQVEPVERLPLNLVPAYSERTAKVGRKLEEVLAAVDALHAEGQEVNGGALGRQLGKDASTGRRHLRDYRPEIEARLAALKEATG